MTQRARIPQLSALAATVMSINGVANAQVTGPSTATPPYVLPSAPNVRVTSLFTVGDSVNNKPNGTPYRMVGIPDGLGAYDNGDGTFTLLMNHEIAVGTTAGVAAPAGGTRAHGNAGAFVSLWTLNKSDVSVVRVEDFVPNNASIFLSDNDPDTATIHSGFLAGATTPMGRLCSADLAGPGAYGWTDPATGTFYGTAARIFQSGEEQGGIVTSVAPGGDLGPEASTHYGRQFAFIATDDPNVPGDEARTAYEMPHHGLFAWENNLASPYAQRKTVVAGMDDGSPTGQVYFWVGDKQTTGNVVERAGLVRQSSNDNLYVVKVSGLTPDASGATNEVVASPLSGRFTLEDEGDVSGLTFAALESLGDSKGGTQFFRPEDGHWDPNSPNDFYFVTTHTVGASAASRLYRLRFDDIKNPTAGGTIAAIIDGGGVGVNTGFGTGEMYDNMAVDSLGRVILQEDVGNNALLGKVWVHDLATGGTLEVARHDPDKFLTGAPNFITQDEENSGVIDVSDILGPGKYLMTDQIHKAITGELVEQGQLQLLTIGATAGTGFDAKTNAPAFVALGTDAAETIVLSASGDYSATVDGQLLPPSRVTGAAITTVLSSAYAGDDKVTAGGVPVPVALFGGDGRDILTGGVNDDVLVGGEGKDTLKGGGGSDTIVQ